MESFMVRTVVNRGAAVRLLRSGAFLLLLVEVRGGANRFVLHLSGHELEPPTACTCAAQDRLADSESAVACRSNRQDLWMKIF